MARKVIYQLVDDLDGAELAEGAGETVEFALDGTAYEIDLSEANAAELRGALDAYITAARQKSRVRRTAAATSAKPARRNLAPIREWAAEQGHELPKRGRIPVAIVDAYEAAHA